MKITGRKTDSVYRRYRIVSESDILDALKRRRPGYLPTHKHEKSNPFPPKKGKPLMPAHPHKSRTISAKVKHPAPFEPSASL
jgi:hypothetical protein